MFILIPARGGSKSIPRKNMALLGGIPLIEYSIRASLACDIPVYVSTDDAEIFNVAASLGARPHLRPCRLALDSTPIIDVIDFVAKDLRREREPMALVQPTSPFVTPGDIRQCLGAVAAECALWDSAQTITVLPHNHHEVNQRRLSSLDMSVSFAHPWKRKRQHNKQQKERRWSFGNCIAFRPVVAIRERSPFPGLCHGVPIPRHHAMDVDGPEDLEIAEAMLKAGLVDLLHMKERKAA